MLIYHRRVIKNKRVMALGTKEEGHFAEVGEEGKEEELIIFKGLYSPNLFVRSSQVWTNITILTQGANCVKPKKVENNM